MRTTVKILRRKHRDGRREYRAFCLRCSQFVADYRDHVAWFTRKTVDKYAIAHLEWHQDEDRTPVPDRWYWKNDWLTISEVSDGDEKEIVA